MNAHGEEPEQTARVAFGEGWSIGLPLGFVTRRNDDGSWSASAPGIVADIKTLSTSGTPSGPISPARMIRGFEDVMGGETLTFAEGGRVGKATFASKPDDRGRTVWWLHSAVATENRAILCSVGMVDPAKRELALAIWRSIENAGSNP